MPRAERGHILKIMKKKIIISLIIILLLVVGGVFWWRQNRETPPEKWETAKVSPREDYIVKETPEGKLVENKKVEISFQIPNNWTLNEATSSFMSDISLYSPDAEIGEKSYLLQNGCKVSVKVTYIKTNVDTIERVLKEKFTWSSMILNKYERTEINNRIAVKHIFEDENLKMYVIGIHLPIKNKVYEIMLDAASQDKEQCEIEFDKFLETISID